MELQWWMLYEANQGTDGKPGFWPNRRTFSWWTEAERDLEPGRSTSTLLPELWAAIPRQKLDESGVKPPAWNGRWKWTKINVERSKRCSEQSCNEETDLQAYTPYSENESSQSPRWRDDNVAPHIRDSRRQGSGVGGKPNTEAGWSSVTVGVQTGTVSKSVGYLKVNSNLWTTWHILWPGHSTWSCFTPCSLRAFMWRFCVSCFVSHLCGLLCLLLCFPGVFVVTFWGFLHLCGCFASVCGHFVRLCGCFMSLCSRLVCPYGHFPSLWGCFVFTQSFHGIHPTPPTHSVIHSNLNLNLNICANLLKPESVMSFCPPDRL